MKLMYLADADPQFALLIGPEGGLSEAEISSSKSERFRELVYR